MQIVRVASDDANALWSYFAQTWPWTQSENPGNVRGPMPLA